MTSDRSLTAFALLTTLAVTPACGDLGSPRVEWMDYKPDGSLVAFMATGIHVLGPALDHETMTIGFDGLPAMPADSPNSFRLSADGRLAAVYFPAPPDSAGPSTIALFDLTTGAMAQTFHPDAPAADSFVFALELSPQVDLVYSRSSYELTMGGPVLFRSTVTDVGSGLPLWTTDRLMGRGVFSADGARLFVHTITTGDSPAAHIEALDARTGATLYAVDVPGELDGLALTADGKLAGVIHPVDPSCTTFGACPPGYAFWSPADLALLQEQPGLPQTEDASVRDLYAAFDCSRWSSLCALGSIDVSHLPIQPGSYFVSVVRTDGTLAQRLAVQGAVSVSAFSPDGQLIATAPLQPGPIDLFRIADGTRVATLGLHGDLP